MTVNGTGSNKAAQLRAEILRLQDQLKKVEQEELVESRIARMKPKDIDNFFEFLCEDDVPDKEDVLVMQELAKHGFMLWTHNSRNKSA